MARPDESRSKNPPRRHSGWTRAARRTCGGVVTQRVVELCQVKSRASLRSASALRVRVSSLRCRPLRLHVDVRYACGGRTGLLSIIRCPASTRSVTPLPVATRFWANRNLDPPCSDQAWRSRVGREQWAGTTDQLRTRQVIPSTPQRSTMDTSEMSFTLNHHQGPIWRSKSHEFLACPLPPPMILPIAHLVEFAN